MYGRVRYLVPVVWLVWALSSFAGEAPQVVVNLEIRDELTGTDLDVSIRRKAAQGINGIDFLEEVVDVDYRRYPGTGVFVTSLCGVEAPKGTFWALSINGERATKGISDLTINETTRIRWNLVEQEEP